MRIVGIVQARMGSTRLPGKVLADLCGRPTLEWCLTRLAQCKTLNEIVIATSIEPEDELLFRWCTDHGFRCVRGSLNDVLDRYWTAAQAAEADAIVRITSDCPLIDPGVVDQVVKAFLERVPHLDYCSNTYPRRTFPRGLDAEVFTCAALHAAWKDDADFPSREHVTPYLYHHPERFRLYNVVGQMDHSADRWTVDTPEDLELVRRIAQSFSGRLDFTWNEILALLDENPKWRNLNRHIEQKKVG